MRSQQPHLCEAFLCVCVCVLSECRCVTARGQVLCTQGRPHLGNLCGTGIPMLLTSWGLNLAVVSQGV